MLQEKIAVETVVCRGKNEFVRLRGKEDNAAKAVRTYREGLADRFKRRAEEFEETASLGVPAKGRAMRAAAVLMDVLFEACGVVGPEAWEIRQVLGLALNKKKFEDLNPMRGLDYDGAVKEITAGIRGRGISQLVAGALLAEVNVKLNDAGCDLSEIVCKQGNGQVI